MAYVVKFVIGVIMLPMLHRDKVDNAVQLTPKPLTPETAEYLEQAPGDRDAVSKSQVLSFLQEIVETVALALVIWVVVNLTTARYVVDGPSMESSLYTGNRLIVSRLAYKFGDPARGDVVVFRTSPTGESLVKRVIGLPGETLTIQAGKVYIDGQRINEPYISSDTYLPHEGRWSIPEGYYFVMGDNRLRSSDSRRWGLIPEEDITGKAWLIYWPPGDISRVPHQRDY
jgi:signal peptidase I